MGQFNGPLHVGSQVITGCRPQQEMFTLCKSQCGYCGTARLGAIQQEKIAAYANSKC